MSINAFASLEMSASSELARSFCAMTRLVVVSSWSSVSRMRDRRVALTRIADSRRKRSRSRKRDDSSSCRFAFISWSSFATVSETSASPSRMRVLSSRLRVMSASVSRSVVTRSVSVAVSASAAARADWTRASRPFVSPSTSAVFASTRVRSSSTISCLAASSHVRYVSTSFASRVVSPSAVRSAALVRSSDAVRVRKAASECVSFSATSARSFISSWCGVSSGSSGGGGGLLSSPPPLGSFFFGGISTRRELCASSGCFLFGEGLVQNGIEAHRESFSTSKVLTAFAYDYGNLYD